MGISQINVLVVFLQLRIHLTSCVLGVLQTCY